ncbi:MAG: tyrosine-type recombinase/integrase, partial [Rhodoplanes sp.]
TEWGKPFTANGFGGWFRDRCDEAELPHCSAHGLRKAGATIAAERGATDRQLMAMFGWESSRQATTYTASADRKRLAAEAARLIASDHTANIDCPTELPHRKKA